MPSPKRLSRPRKGYRSPEIQCCRQQAGGIVWCVQGPTDIQDNAMVAGSDFDTVTADLVSSPMDGEPHVAH
jgi:hypothetical protein